MRLSLHTESMAQLRQGLALLGQLPPSLERDQQELALLLTLGRRTTRCGRSRCMLAIFLLPGGKAQLGHGEGDAQIANKQA
jgi:hypothetical protein